MGPKRRLKEKISASPPEIRCIDMINHQSLPKTTKEIPATARDHEDSLKLSLQDQMGINSTGRSSNDKDEANCDKQNLQSPSSLPVAHSIISSSDLITNDSSSAMGNEESSSSTRREEHTRNSLPMIATKTYQSGEPIELLHHSKDKAIALNILYHLCLCHYAPSAMQLHITIAGAIPVAHHILMEGNTEEKLIAIRLLSNLSENKNIHFVMNHLIEYLVPLIDYYDIDMKLHVLSIILNLFLQQNNTRYTLKILMKGNILQKIKAFLEEVIVPLKNEEEAEVKQEIKATAVTYAAELLFHLINGNIPRQKHLLGDDENADQLIRTLIYLVTYSTHTALQCFIMRLIAELARHRWFIKEWIEKYHGIPVLINLLTSEGETAVAVSDVRRYAADAIGALALDHEELLEHIALEYEVIPPLIALSNSINEDEAKAAQQTLNIFASCSNIHDVIPRKRKRMLKDEGH